jgi:hypothetical protein
MDKLGRNPLRIQSFAPRGAGEEAGLTVASFLTGRLQRGGGIVCAALSDGMLRTIALRL